MASSRQMSYLLVFNLFILFPNLVKRLRTPREFYFGGQWDLITELPQDWGNRLLEGTNKTFCAPRAKRKEQCPHKRLSQTFLWVSRSLWWRCGLTEWNHYLDLKSWQGEWHAEEQAEVCNGRHFPPRTMKLKPTPNKLNLKKFPPRCIIIKMSTSERLKTAKEKKCIATHRNPIWLSAGFWAEVDC